MNARTREAEARMDTLPHLLREGRRARAGGAGAATLSDMAGSLNRQRGGNVGGTTSRLPLNCGPPPTAPPPFHTLVQATVMPFAKWGPAGKRIVSGRRSGAWVMWGAVLHAHAGPVLLQLCT